MIDRYTKLILTVIAVNLTIMTAGEIGRLLFPDAFAGERLHVYVDGGTLDYQSSFKRSGPTLKVSLEE